MNYPSVKTFLRGRVDITMRRPGFRNHRNLKREAMAYLDGKKTWLRRTARGDVPTFVNEARAKLLVKAYARVLDLPKEPANA